MLLSDILAEMSEQNYSKYYDLLKQSKLLRGLSSSELDFVCEQADPWIQNFKKGTRLWSQGDFVPYIDILDKGIFISQKYHLDGRIQLICSFTRPEIINLEAPASFKGTSPVFIVASSDCRVLRISYKRLIQNANIAPNIRMKIMENISAYLADDSIRYMYKSEVLSQRKVKDRVITFLNVLRHQTGNDLVDTGMSQEEFAQYLCVDRTSLSETINELRREGIIDFRKSKFTLNFPKTGSGL